MWACVVALTMGTGCWTLKPGGDREDVPGMGRTDVTDVTSVDVRDASVGTDGPGVDVMDVPTAPDSPYFVFQFVGGALTGGVDGGPSANLQITWSGTLVGSSDGGSISFQGTIR